MYILLKINDCLEKRFGKIFFLNFRDQKKVRFYNMKDLAISDFDFAKDEAYNAKRFVIFT